MTVSYVDLFASYHSHFDEFDVAATIYNKLCPTKNRTSVTEARDSDDTSGIRAVLCACAQKS